MYNKKDLLKWYDEDYCLEAVKQMEDPYNM